jgi:hypothetical protein
VDPWDGNPFLGRPIEEEGAEASSSTRRHLYTLRRVGLDQTGARTRSEYVAYHPVKVVLPHFLRA